MKEKQHDDPILSKLIDVVYQKNIEFFSHGGDRVFHSLGHLCVPNVDELRERTLE